MRYRIYEDSPESSNLWKWGRQFQGDGPYMQQHARQVLAVRKEVARFGGRMTIQRNFVFPTKDQMVHFRLVWA